MTDVELVIVDANVLLDVIEADPQWMEWSAQQMSRFPSRLIINPLIYAELCGQAASTEEVDGMMDMLGLLYQELPRESLFLTSKAFKIYRSRGGAKTASLADFFIGAHAQALNIPILTRDVTRCRGYFPKVRLISP